MAQMIFFLNIFFVLYPSFCASKFLAGISPFMHETLENIHILSFKSLIDRITIKTNTFLFTSFSCFYVTYISCCFCYTYQRSLELILRALNSIDIYRISSYKALPRIIPATLIIPAILTILSSRNAFEGYVK